MQDKLQITGGSVPHSQVRPGLSQPRPGGKSRKTGRAGDLFGNFAPTAAQLSRPTTAPLARVLNLLKARLMIFQP